VSAITAAVAGPLSACGLTLLLAQLARDAGKNKEPILFDRWNGKPSTRMMRHSDPTLNPLTRARYHQKAAQLLGEPMPSAEEEATNPVAADRLYEAYGDLLRERTRDTRAFRLLFEELTNSGFRRNLWGLKPVGLSICVGSA
jgi:hypothetical protein